MKEVLPCAIYTRKSTEDGLEQGFNSLDAQKEACEAYILSQKALGWIALPNRYDDGGFSGGNTERPALQRLLTDVAAGRIKIIVVYKVDRLTRSLADFAKLVERFDAQGVSFVSVTQQFNTTSSMGRLTLNVLLSFAQFEREVTGERIRDKIAASKRKGMWMGGCVPMGYLPSDRTLVIDEPNAQRVREIYRLYLEFDCVRRLKAEIDQREWVTPIRKTRRTDMTGGKPFSRGHLYLILSNPIYIGQIVHKGSVFPGQHEAIVDADLWQAVQDRLLANRQGNRRRTNAKEPALLAGLVFDSEGQRLASTHTKKGARRYRYYIEQSPIGERSTADGAKDDHDKLTSAMRWPAQELESVVTQAVVRFLTDKSRLLELLGAIPAKEARGRLIIAEQQAKTLAGTTAEKYTSITDKIAILQGLINRITVRVDRLEIAVQTCAVGTSVDEVLNDESVALIEVPVELKRRGKAIKLIVEPSDHLKLRGPDTNLICLIAKAHNWFTKLTSGRYTSVYAIAEEEGVTRAYVTKIVHLAFLAPDILERCLSGDHPVQFSARRLARMGTLPLNWDDQRRRLGMLR